MADEAVAVSSAGPFQLLHQLRVDVGAKSRYSISVDGFLLIKQHAKMNGQSEEIEDYLLHVASSDVEFGALVPKEETSRRLEEEIAAKSGWEAITFGVDENMSKAKELPRSSISADPAQFPREAVELIGRVMSELKQAGATRFELLLRNMNHSERITVSVRYI